LFVSGLDVEDDDLVQDEVAVVGLRRYAHFIVCHHWMDNFVAFLVIVNIVVIGIETDLLAKNAGAQVPSWVLIANWSIFSLFLIEVATRIFVFKWMFFRNALNLVDLAVVGMDLVSELFASIEALPSFSAFRIMRLLRLGGRLRVSMHLPQLGAMVKGVASALSATLWGFVLIAITVMLWSVVATQVVHPLNMELVALGEHADCERCKHAFASVTASALTLFQTFILGDSFGLLIIPVADAYPWVILIFICVFITVNVAVLNVILAVIVESAMRVSQDDARMVALERNNYYKQRMNHLIDICREIDTDDSGTLQLEELLEALESHEAFRAELRAMDITKSDMSVIFNMLDSDGSGDVDYTEVAEGLHRMKSHDAHTMLVFIQHYCQSIHNSIVDLKVVHSSDFERLNCALCGHGHQTQAAEVKRCEPKDRDAKMVRVQSKERFPCDAVATSPRATAACADCEFREFSAESNLYDFGVTL
jgi:voltage-gated sodium channel